MATYHRLERAAATAVLTDSMEAILKTTEQYRRTDDTSAETNTAVVEQQILALSMYVESIFDYGDRPMGVDVCSPAVIRLRVDRLDATPRGTQ